VDEDEADKQTGKTITGCIEGNCFPSEVI
jgi:hypothetical protein